MAYGFFTAPLLGILYSPHTLVSYPIMTRLGIAQKEAVGVAVGGTIVTSILTLTGLFIMQAIAGGSIGIQLWIKLLVLLPALVLVYLWALPKLDHFIRLWWGILPTFLVNVAEFRVRAQSGYHYSLG